MPDKQIVCNICGNQVKVLYDFGSYQWFKCPDCGFCFSSTMIGSTLEEVCAQYDENYFRAPIRLGWVLGGDRVRVKVWTKHLHLLRRLSGASGKGKLLDIGCGLGFFPDMAQRSGWEAHAVEVGDFAAKYARDKFKLDVFAGTVEEANFPSAHFDVVTLWDLMEHLNKPEQTVAEISRITKPGGLILIFTPNQDSLVDRLIYLTYRFSVGKARSLAQKVYIPVQHLCFFSPRVLTLILRRQSYEVEYFETVPLQAYRCSIASRIVRSGATVVDFIGRVFNSSYHMVMIGRKVK